MRKVTLCFLVDKDNVCLAMKKRGFGKGKWNGAGGKVDENETIETAAIRELEEEIGVKVAPSDLNEVGDLAFAFENKPEWSQHMYIFLIEKWQGEPTETEEMRPKWFSKDNLPFDKMWVDDPLWLPRVLDGEKISGAFTFSSDGSKIRKHIVNKQTKTP